MTRQPKLPKYAEIIDEEPRPFELLKESDRRELARLVGKYGRPTIAAAAKEIPLPSRGRPPLYLSRQQDMDLADWIEERAEKHRQAESGKPYMQAAIDLYEMQCQSDLKRFGKVLQPDINEYLKKIKKARLRGRPKFKRKGL